MRTAFLAALVVFLVAGCQAKPKATDAAAASGPQAIEELSNQHTVYECPKCGMDYDKPGQCPMDKVALVETQVDYICPADGQPVEHAGRCPRCAANARVVKTAMAAPATEPATGN